MATRLRCGEWPGEDGPGLDGPGGIYWLPVPAKTHFAELPSNRDTQRFLKSNPLLVISRDKSTRNQIKKIKAK